MGPIPLQAVEFSHSPLLTFVVGLLVVVALLVWLDFPAFIGLVIAGFTVGLVNAVFVPDFTSTMAATEVAGAFGDNMAGIGIPILMAAVIGKAMLESGAAQRVVRGFQNVLGESNSDIALLGSSSVLAIPVFFDSVFYLMAPLARSMRARVGRDYTLFIVTVGTGAAAAHVFVPPTPGPLAVAAEVGSDLGMTILIGIITAIPAVLIAGLGYGRWINARLDIPLRDTMSTTTEELEAVAERPTSELPGILESLAPIIVAVALIGSATAVDTFQQWFPVLATLEPIVGFLGDKNVALMFAAVVASISFYRHDDLMQSEWSDELTEALKSGGNIAAITAAGGAFGALLAASGIGDYIAGSLQEVGIPLLVTAWLIAAVVRIAQGSATAAMLTAAGIMAPLVGQLSVHPAYLVMVIGAGGNICSWYNDSGFWLVKEIGGLTQEETLKTWTVLTTLIAVSGLVTTLVFSSVFPFA
ncbi:GntP family gluconate:H+ symporter [Halorubrum trapanicum]|uniref:GntP family gluconate:H+ symporter n=1 Tax=Halorubrum trapanicum TaxID=29284 RepID=A0A8J7RRM1_9EURY|nr:gluconate:H+ symporter [Halorubrum trapanicum]MBP1902067.1 GntP family gluconate:H+ symporter [Halorubrum trapanicum]